MTPAARPLTIRPAATTHIAPAEWTRGRKAFADLVRGERRWRRQLGGERFARTMRLGQAFAEDAHLRDGNQRDGHHAFHTPAEHVMKSNRQREHPWMPPDDVRH